MRNTLSGALAAGFLVVALYFLRFWKQSRDRLFLQFAAAFVLFGINALAVTHNPRGDARVVVYGVRLAGFVLILYAIYDKNRK
jgi:hypothetical protein